MNCLNTYISCFAILLLFAGCNSHARNTSEIEEGQVIYFPTEIEYRANGTEKIMDVSHVSPYRIIAYYDSITCMDCNFSMSEWQQLDDDLQHIAPGKCEIILLFSSRFKREVRASMVESGVKRIVGFDIGNKFLERNNLPRRIEDRFFLTDSTGKILERGNAAMSPDAKYRFISRILGQETYPRPDTGSSAEIVPEKIDFGIIKIGEWIDTIVRICNLSTDSIRVLKLRSSCSCTVTEWDRSSIMPAGEKEIKVRYTADKTGRARRNILIYLSSQKRPLELSMTVEVVD